jgi:esterase/lipase
MTQPPHAQNGDGAVHRVTAPRLVRQVMEIIWPLEAVTFVAAAPMLRLTRPGDGHPVLVLPGFTADDASTVPLRWAIRGQGYSTHAWRLGRNVGPTRHIVEGIRNRVEELAERHERTISIVGWSLGGTYARALAREYPTLVRQVISLGSPYRMVEGDESSAMWMWRRYEYLHDGDLDLNRIAEQNRPKLTVPATSIYSRRDGVAQWQTCIDEVGPLAENIEVHGSHAALGMQAAVVYAVLDRLRQPEGEWRPFRPPLAARVWYPRPVTWQPRPGHRAQLVDV